VLKVGGLGSNIDQHLIDLSNKVCILILDGDYVGISVWQCNAFMKEVMP